MFEYFPLVLNASLVTIELALFSLFLGMIFAILLVIGESSKNTIINRCFSALTTLLRGLPEILVVFLIYFGIPQLIFYISDDFIEFPVFLAGSLALAIIFGAYASQSLRGAIAAIPKGQWEASAALGISKASCFIHVIMPQVWRHALPGLSNQWLVLLKDTALVSLIGLDDLMRQADLINANTHQPFTWYSIIGLIYLAITLVSQFIIRKLEYKFTSFEREAA